MRKLQVPSKPSFHSNRYEPLADWFATRSRVEAVPGRDGRFYHPALGDASWGILEAL